jgi:hypothetical protein
MKTAHWIVHEIPFSQKNSLDAAASLNVFFSKQMICRTGKHPLPALCSRSEIDETAKHLWSTNGTHTGD